MLQMKKVYIIAFGLISVLVCNAQNRLMTKAATISFYSKAPMENIEATNKSGVSVIDKTTGQLEFSVLLKGFSFEKALMQEHFNENYVESDLFPKTGFKGKITDQSKVNFAKEGIYNVPITGTLSLHGVSKEITTSATITIRNGVTEAEATFNIDVEDYKIKIPSIVKDKIAKTIKITVKANYQPL